mmetsp:Transcript_21290/g.50461  ORF Transcript_21290/g.50461 Transcript_21290/m.50461 type:complete len:206 (+) Transcript_21290:222-839(+)
MPPSPRHASFETTSSPCCFFAALTTRSTICDATASVGPLAAQCSELSPCSSTSRVLAPLLSSTDTASRLPAAHATRRGVREYRLRLMPESSPRHGRVISSSSHTPPRSDAHASNTAACSRSLTLLSAASLNGANTASPARARLNASSHITASSFVKFCHGLSSKCVLMSSHGRAACRCSQRWRSSGMWETGTHTHDRPSIPRDTT